MEQVTAFTVIGFSITTLLSIVLFSIASRKPLEVFFVICLWATIQILIASSGFYLVTDTIPPRFVLLIGPPLLFILLLFLTQKGKDFIDTFDIRALTLMHIVRLPIEIVLFALFIDGAVPELMTFDGRNFDILSGLSAPIIYFIGFKNDKPAKTLLLVWNFVCLALLFNIVINAALSAPGPLQMQAFEQPNIAILNPPFNLLPSVVVPLVLLSHIISIRQLIRDKV